MTSKILNKNEKEEIINKLRNQFGIKKIHGILLKSGTERIFLFQGSLERHQITKLENNRMSIERIGIYFAKEQGSSMRLSIDGIHLLKDQISKNIFKIQNQEDLENWMHGNELNIQTDLKGFVIMKYKNDFLGTGKASQDKITNFIPKSRRLKNKN